MSQLSLFGSSPNTPRSPGPVGPAEVTEELLDLAAALPESVRLGTSTWSFPGWAGLVYDRVVSERILARQGLAAYASHPLLNTVGVDRTFYRPLDEEGFRTYAEAVPDDFCFVVKAHDHLTQRVFPSHPRFGALAGQENSRFLDPVYATEEVLGPMVRGLGSKVGVLVFQFPPQDLGPQAEFLARLERFFDRLPRSGDSLVFAVEVRNRSLLTSYKGRYGALLAAADVAHCLAGHPRMPSLREQSDATLALGGPALVVRWMLRSEFAYEEAKSCYAPFDRLVDPDPERRSELASLVREAVVEQTPVFVTINNKAEGSAPQSAIALAREIVDPNSPTSTLR